MTSVPTFFYGASGFSTPARSPGFSPMNRVPFEEFSRQLFSLMKYRKRFQAFLLVPLSPFMDPFTEIANYPLRGIPLPLLCRPLLSFVSFLKRLSFSLEKGLGLPSVLASTIFQQGREEVLVLRRSFLPPFLPRSIFKLSGPTLFQDFFFVFLTASSHRCPDLKVGLGPPLRPAPRDSLGKRLFSVSFFWFSYTPPTSNPAFQISFQAVPFVF